MKNLLSKKLPAIVRTLPATDLLSSKLFGRWLPIMRQTPVHRMAMVAAGLTVAAGAVAGPALAFDGQPHHASGSAAQAAGSHTVSSPRGGTGAAPATANSGGSGGSVGSGQAGTAADAAPAGTTSAAGTASAPAEVAKVADAQPGKDAPSQDAKAGKDAKDAKPGKDAKAGKDAKPGKDAKGGKDAKPAQPNQDSQAAQAAQQAQKAQAAKQALENSLPRDKEVGVDYQSQTTFFYCGPAATRIVASAQGHDLSQDDVAARLGTTVNGTPSAVDTTRVLNDILGGNTYHTTSIPDRQPSQAQTDQVQVDMMRTLNGGRAVVANIAGTTTDVTGATHEFDGGHYVAVVGYHDQGGTVEISDPADVNGADSYWISTSNLTQWMATRGYSSAG